MIALLAGALAVDVAFPDDFGVHDVFLIAGHGNGDKDGNTGVHGQIEAETSLDTALRLGAALEATGHLHVVQGRTDDRPSFAARLRRLDASGAPCLVELHTDARADAARPWAVSWKGETLWRWDESPGFTVLYNEGGPLGPERQRLARDLATALVEAGLSPWTGGYGDLYDFDGVPGVYIDRRQLYMLRRPTVPSVIIETHNALDFEESLRWREDATHEAFAQGMALGLMRWFQADQRT